jgi:3-hydroxyisobutyrate dehydrogenase-like beta-hydroxyacid dehydrogenase
MKITLIGLGKMGSVLGQRLLAAKFDLTVFNRTAEKMKPLIDAGAKGAKTIEEAVKEAQIVVTCLLDDNAVLESVAHFAPLLRAKTIHLGTSTILPETSKKLTEIHRRHGNIYVAGNILGVPKAAARGELTTFVAGSDHAIQQCKPIFDAYSSKVVTVGSHPFQANVMKICMNYMLISAIETMGELYAFAEKSEIDTSMLNTMFHSIYAHPAFKLYVDKIKGRDFDNVNFDMNGGYKDVSLFQQAFANVGVVPDIANVVRDKFIVALAHQMNEKDWSAITDITRRQANI